MTAIESRLRAENLRLIGLETNGSNLSLSESEWRESLARAVPDEKVGIRHEQIAGDSTYRTHVAAIPRQVGCHYHSQGNEDYAVVEGQGVLFFGKVEGGKVAPESWRSIEVHTGDSFVIPEGYAHQLRKTGDDDLTILFGCPDSHLDDNADRFMLPDAPMKISSFSADSK